MILRPRTERPVIKPVLLFDREIIDAGVTALHESARIKLPHFVSVRTKPLPGLIVRLVGKADRNSFFIKSPQLFDQAVLEFLRPLPAQEGDDLISAIYKFVAIAPTAIEGVALRNFFRVTRVPVILGGSDLESRSLPRKWGHKIGRSHCANIVSADLENLSSRLSSCEVYCLRFG